MVLSAGDRFGDAEAVVDGPLRLSFAELTERIRRAAGAFAALGVQKGDRVAVWAPNSAEWIIAAFGLLTAGGVLVPVNTRFKTEEAGDIIRRSGAKAVLVDTGFFAGFLGQEFDVPAGVPAIDLKSDFLGSGQPFEHEVNGLKGTDTGDIIYTSGTTGRPKGAMMHHLQTLRMYEEWATRAICEGDRYLMVNPYFHTFGYKAGLIASFLRGATMLPVAVFDIDRVVELIESEQIADDAARVRRRCITRCSLSATRQAVVVARGGDRRRRHPGRAGWCVHQELPFQTLMTGYGLTEAGNVTLSRPGDSFDDVATTAGLPCDGVDVRIADDGEVLVRGYGVMKGYFDDPVATADAIDDQGWLHTGDLGKFDGSDGCASWDARKTCSSSAGSNAYPAEIEGFLLKHPAVEQAAVIGVPDERLGQVGKAFVVATGEVTGDELIKVVGLRHRMAGFKVPRFVEFLDALPLNATGKVQKDRLR